MKIRKSIIKALGILLIVLTILLIITTIAFVVVRINGKKAIYKEVESVAPTLALQTIPEDDGIVLYKGGQYRYNEDILTFLVMGIDEKKLGSRDEVKNYVLGGQADALFLVVINPHNQDVSLIAVNRNSMGEVDVYDENNEFVRTDRLQICLQHGYGSGFEDSAQRQVKTVSKLFYDLPIHGYVSLNMYAVPIMNDAVGGITVEILDDLPVGTNAIKHQKGQTVTLWGMDAYDYLHYRDTKVFDSVSTRLARQKQYLSSFVRVFVDKTKQDLTFPVAMLGQIKDYVLTDVSTSELVYLASTYVNYHFNLDDIKTLKGETIVGTGDFEEFIVDDDALYELIINTFYEKVD